MAFRRTATLLRMSTVDPLARGPIRAYGRTVPPPEWHLVDAKDKVVGHLAGKIAKTLMGKHKPCYLPHINAGDCVVVINAGDVRFTGKKEEKKLYKWHTRYPGGFRQINPRDLRKKHPTEILRKAVRGMLPKNKLKALRERNLLVYADDEGLKKHRAQLKGKEPTDLDFV